MGTVNSDGEIRKESIETGFGKPLDPNVIRHRKIQFSEQLRVWTV